MKAKVSVILPSLNVADYIEECMDSLLRQTLQELEILCIDAGSTDGTEEVLRQYAKSDPRIILLHSDIKSYGKQVNMGLAYVSGEYVAILETDDWIVPEIGLIMLLRILTGFINSEMESIILADSVCLTWIKRTGMTKYWIQSRLQL